MLGSAAAEGRRHPRVSSSSARVANPSVFPPVVPGGERRCCRRSAVSHMAGSDWLDRQLSPRRASRTGDEIIFDARGRSTWPSRQECSDGSTAARRQKRPAGMQKNSRLVHVRTSPSDGVGLAGSSTAEQGPSASSGRVATRSPASAGDQASANGEGLGRTVIGRVGLSADAQMSDLEAGSRS